MSLQDKIGPMDADEIRNGVLLPPVYDPSIDRDEYNHKARAFINETIQSLPEDKTTVSGEMTINKRANAVKVALRVSEKLIRTNEPNFLDIRDNAYLHYQLGRLSQGETAVHQLAESVRKYDWLLRTGEEPADPHLEMDLGTAYFFLGTAMMNNQDTWKEETSRSWGKIFRKAYAHLENSKDNLIYQGVEPPSLMEVLLEESEKYLSKQPIQLERKPDHGFPPHMLN